MKTTLTHLLDENAWLLADGATGTNLFNAGLKSGEAPEIWNLEFPIRITTLYQNAVDAGSDIFLTNTFGGNASRLKLHEMEKQVLKINQVSAEIARNVADKSSKPVLVAGSVGPTGDLFEPIGSLTHESAVEMFHEQAEGLKSGGVDVLWVETISALEEFKAAAEAFKLVDMPWCGTMSFDSAGRTMMGITSVDLVSMVENLPNKPLAFGANCGVGASDLLRTVLGFSTQPSTIPIIAKGNAGIPKYLDGHIHYDGSPDFMSDYAILARNSGAKIIGGCCGTTPKHLSSMRKALENTIKSSPPTLEEIIKILGGFSSESDGTDGIKATSHRGKRRKRKL